MLDEEGAEPGSKATKSLSLTGRIMATWGTDKSVLTEGEVRALKEWFENGGGKTDEEVLNEEKAGRP